MKIERISVDSYKYNEPKLVYTGATVGGVTTGGFHVEGGDYTKKTAGYTQKFRLVYSTGKLDEKSRMEYRPVEEIVLCSSDLVSKAAKTPIVKDFLCRNRIILPNPYPVRAEDYEKSLTREKAWAIYEWCWKVETEQ